MYMIFTQRTMNGNELKVCIVMGVAGCGKTTVGSAIAEKCNVAFLDADDYHSFSNKQKMLSGIALTDEDRTVWLFTLDMLLAGCYAARKSVVIACSALKRQYRKILFGTNNHRANCTEIIYLKISEETARRRVNNRQDHFFPSKLITSQFEALQPPEADECSCVLEINANMELKNVINSAVEHFQKCTNSRNIQLGESIP
ncbi:putative gluconokinase [Trichinella papuae]|uniref:Gluconokinase n=1 Tax=Trichinella papuae TaxID=268474 RepID=A0A0V1MU55_9BILA|nr:putative gluconokinase [Trichinella papuae]